MATRDELMAFLDELLEPEAFDDYGPNGLQVPGADHVERIVTGVSAGLELFERAAQEGAQLVLCHHGILWDFHPRTVTPQMKGRLQALFEADISLAAFHLPLDAHPQHGNNALICEALGLERAEPFGPARPAPGAAPRPIGFVGRSAEGVAVEELLARCREAFGQEPVAWLDGPDPVHALGVVSGAAASSLGPAIARGLDGLLTGEPAEHTMADARESGVHFLACGHYATETRGVRRLGALLEQRFGVEHHFVELENPI